MKKEKKEDKINKSVRLNIIIDDDLKKAFISSAKKNNSDASKIVRGWIIDYLGKNK